MPSAVTICSLYYTYMYTCCHFFVLPIVRCWIPFQLNDRRFSLYSSRLLYFLPHVCYLLIFQQIFSARLSVDGGQDLQFIGSLDEFGPGQPWWAWLWHHRFAICSYFIRLFLHAYRWIEGKTCSSLDEFGPVQPWWAWLWQHRLPGMRFFFEREQVIKRTKAWCGNIN